MKALMNIDEQRYYLHHLGIDVWLQREPSSLIVDKQSCLEVTPNDALSTSSLVIYSSISENTMKEERNFIKSLFFAFDLDYQNLCIARLSTNQTVSINGGAKPLAIDAFCQLLQASSSRFILVFGDIFSDSLKVLKENTGVHCVIIPQTLTEVMGHSKCKRALYQRLHELVIK